MSSRTHAMAADSARIGKGTIRKQASARWQGRRALETTVDSPAGVALELVHVAAGDTVHVLALARVSDPKVRSQFRESFVVR